MTRKIVLVALLMAFLFLPGSVASQGSMVTLLPRHMAIIRANPELNSLGVRVSSVRGGARGARGARGSPFFSLSKPQRLRSETLTNMFLPEARNKLGFSESIMSLGPLQKIGESNYLSIEKILRKKALPFISGISPNFGNNLSYIQRVGYGLLVADENGNLDVKPFSEIINEQSQKVEYYLKQGNMENAFNTLNENHKLITSVSIMIEENFKNRISYFDTTRKKELENIRSHITSKFDVFSSQLNAIEKEVHLYRWLLIGLFGLFGIDTLIKRMRKKENNPNKTL